MKKEDGSTKRKVFTFTTTASASASSRIVRMEVAAMDNGRMDWGVLGACGAWDLIISSTIYIYKLRKGKRKREYENFNYYILGREEEGSAKKKRKIRTFGPEG